MSKTLNLTTEDVELLGDVIRTYVSELHDEIAHTESFDFRQGLVAKQERLNALLQQLAGS